MPTSDEILKFLVHLALVGLSLALICGFAVGVALAVVAVKCLF